LSRTYRDKNKNYNGLNRDSDSLVSSEFKKLRRRSRRAKVKNAIRHMEDPPEFKRTDRWDWC